jgi:hypothetical protein
MLNRTLGPRGPFLQSGVDVVSQLAHLLVRRDSTVATLVAPPRLLLFKPGGDDSSPEFKKSQQKRDDSSELVKRVEGVPKERVQSTDDEEEP